MSEMTVAIASISAALTRMTSELTRLYKIVLTFTKGDKDFGICDGIMLDKLLQEVAWAVGGTWEKEPVAEPDEAERAARIGQTVEAFLSVAQILLNTPIKSPDTIVPSSQQTDKALKQDHGPFWDWVQPQLVKCGVPESAAEAERIRIELLTACWLGLYFLGVPSGTPWEYVLRWADEDGGGLPNGVCVAKAIGDIARDARKLAIKSKSFQRMSPERDANPPKGKADGHAAEAGFGAAHSATSDAQQDDLLDGSTKVPERRRQKKMDEPMLIVLSGWPVLLFRDLLDGPNTPGCTPKGAHVLGRCYELLQLALYLRTGEKLRYCIREESVLQTFGFFDDQRQEAMTLEDAFVIWRDGIKGLQSIRADEQDRTDPAVPAKQKVLVISNPPIPPCFINHERGLYTFEMLERHGASDPEHGRGREIPLPASYMKDIRRQLYIDNLSYDEKSERPNLLEPSANDHRVEFERLWALYGKMKANRASDSAYDIPSS